MSQQLRNEQLGALATSTKDGTVSADGYIRLRDVSKNVKEFGAVGDGAANDFSAIQSAIASSGDVSYPSGTFKLGTSGSLGVAGSTTHHFSHGAILRATVATPVTIHGQINASANQQIFSVDGYGAILLPDMQSVSAHWFAPDDTTSLAVALNLNLTNGVEVTVSKPMTLLSPIIVGLTGATSYEGTSLRGLRGPYGIPMITVGASFNAGFPMIRVQNMIRFRMDHIGLDANGRADYCFQNRSDSGLGGYPGWLHEYDSCTFRNARVANVVSGESRYQATVSGDTFTATGHELQNGDTGYFKIEFETGLPPTGFVLNATYYVVQIATNIFKLSATNGGSAITSSDSGKGRWLFAKTTPGDNSKAHFQSCEFAGTTSLPGPISHFAQSGLNTLSTTFDTCGFTSALAAGGITITSIDATANTFTPASGTWVNGSLVHVWPQSSTDSLPPELTADTEYFVVGSTGTVFGLAASQGGSPINISTVGSGTLKITQPLYPFYGVECDGGAVSLNGCLGASMYCDVLLTGAPAEGGTMCTITHLHSQSWRMFRAVTRGVTFTPQIGGTTIVSCTGSDIFGGARSSIDWNYRLYAGLTVVGGAYNHDIKVAGNSTVQIVNPIMLPYGQNSGFQSTISGTLTSVTGQWTENGTLVTRYPRVDVVNSVRSVGTQLFTGVSGRDLFEQEAVGGGDQSFLRPVLGQNLIGLDASIDSSGSAPSGSGLLILRAKAGSSNGIFADADGFHFRTSGASDIADITYPSNVFTLTAANAMYLLGTGGITLSGGASNPVTLHSQGQDVFTSNGVIVVDAHTLATGYLNLKAKTGQDIFYDSDTHQFRTAAAANGLSITSTGTNSGTISCPLDLVLNGTGTVSVTTAGGTGLHIDSSGNTILSGGGVSSVVTLHSQGHDIFTSNGVVVVDASAMSTGYLNLKSKGGQANYYDADTHQFRNAAASNAMTITGGSNSATITAAINLVLTGTGTVAVGTVGGNPVQIDSSGNVIIGITGARCTLNGGTGVIVTSGATQLLALGANTPPLWGKTTLSATSGTTTLSGAQQQTPVIVYAATLSGNSTIDFGNSEGLWFLDISGVTLGIFTLSVKSGTDTVVLPTLSSTKDLFMIRTNGSNNISIG